MLGFLKSKRIQYSDLQGKQSDCSSHDTAGLGRGPCNIPHHDAPALLIVFVNAHGNDITAGVDACAYAAALVEHLLSPVRLVGSQLSASVSSMYC